MSKYAPVNEAGEKPYFVEFRDWRDIIQKIVYADKAADARYRAVGRARPGVGIREIRRATPEDIEAVGPSNYKRVT